MERNKRSTRICNNGCIHNVKCDVGDNKLKFCDYSNQLLTKDREFFISMVGCVAYTGKRT